MKALKLLVIATLTLTSAALANVDEAGEKNNVEMTAQIYSHGNNMVFVKLQNPANSKMKIAITDQDGFVLHSETIKRDLKMLKRFDISNLPSGLYMYKVSNDTYSIVKKIEKK